MASTIDQSFVRQYEAEVHVAYQRMGSKLRNTVRTKGPVTGESTTFQKVGKGTAAQKTRNGDVPVMNLDHSPVECPLSDWYAGEYIDDLDELKTNNNERQIAVNAGAYALGRQTDTLIIEQTDAATTYQTSDNLSTLAAAKFTAAVFEGLGARDVPIDDGDMYGFVSFKVWAKMLTINEFAQHEYVGPDQLPFAGKGLFAKRWLGVLWMPHSGITVASNVSINPIYHKSAIGHAIGKDITTTMSWENTKSAFFANTRMSMGAKLIDTNGVQQLRITENA